jgi:hypothetical protein
VKKVSFRLTALALTCNLLQPTAIMISCLPLLTEADVVGSPEQRKIALAILKKLSSTITMAENQQNWMGYNNSANKTQNLQEKVGAPTFHYKYVFYY